MERIGEVLQVSWRFFGELIPLVWPAITILQCDWRIIKMQQVIAAAVAAGLTGIGFVVKRWLRRERLDEIIARRLKLVSLYQRMTAAKLDIKALEKLERELSGNERP